MTVLIIQHEDEAPPGQLRDALAAAGLHADVRRAHAGDPLPDSAAGLEGLAVLGGEMDADDDERFPHLETTRALIADAAAREIPVLGLCLGGQLCALALGGTVGHRPDGVRIGWRPVVPAAPDPVTAGVDGGARLFHWHRDAFTPPPGATPLLEDGGGFRRGSVTALQAHPEVTGEIVAAWCEMAGAPEQLAGAGLAAADLTARATAHARHGRRLLDAWAAEVRGRPPELSALVVNTGQRELLLRGLDALAAELEAAPFASEVLVLDNASRDGSAAAARAHPAVTRVVARTRRAGVPENLGMLAARARGRFLLFLNEDAEVQTGAVAALHAALVARPDAAVAAAALLAPDGTRQPSAWRFPTPLTALASLLALHPWLVVQSRGTHTRSVDWAQSSAMLVRRDAFEAVGGFDPAFFVYSDEVDLQRRLRDRGLRTLFVPSACAIHHEQLSTDRVPERRIVELSRNRDRYLRKHHGRPTALVVRLLTAATYATRALAALALPGHDARRYLRHVTATLLPGRGSGMREAAASVNAALGRNVNGGQ